METTIATTMDTIISSLQNKAVELKLKATVELKHHRSVVIRIKAGPIEAFGSTHFLTEEAFCLIKNIRSVIRGEDCFLRVTFERNYVRR